MYAQVDIALEEAARSYEKGEAVRAIAVCDGDTAIDALENEIDELCLRLMARICILSKPREAPACPVLFGEDKKS